MSLPERVERRDQAIGVQDKREIPNHWNAVGQVPNQRWSPLGELLRKTQLFSSSIKQGSQTDLGDERRANASGSPTSSSYYSSNSSAALGQGGVGINLGRPGGELAGLNGQEQLDGKVYGARDEEYGEYEDDEVEEQELQHHTRRTAKLLMAGGLAGVVSRTATAPLDRLKMLLQVNDATKRMTMREGIRRMAQEGTLKSFFKGNGANVIKIAPETAIKLTSNDIYKRMLVSDPEDITPPQRMLAGAMAGATAQAIIYPLEMVKTRLAVCAPGTYHGIIDCARKVWVQEGWRSFYRGLLPSMIGILPYAGVDITAFELLKEHILDEYDGVPPPHLILGAGMLSSSLAQFSAYPLALVRTRLQAQGIGGKVLKYKSMTDVLRKTYNKEGFRGLYKGSLTNLAKLAPAAGISWFVFEETKVLLGLSMRS
jgi:solute carrier family 25 phosphate transporter 23/24/25/41